MFEVGCKYSTKTCVYDTNLFFLLSGSDSNTWVLDTTCGLYICNLLQRLHNIKGLKRGVLELYGINGESISIEAVKICMLDLSSDKILKLKDCYYMPKAIRNIISTPLL